MKKLTLLILIAFFVKAVVFSQGCLPGGITFTTQEAIDSFQTDYPDCTEIEGRVMIYGGNITNLVGLSVVTSIGEELVISDNNALTSISGLNNIVEIGGYLVIGYNNELTSLTGLNNIVSINGNLEVIGNNLLTNLSGLDNITTIGGHFRIYENDLLTSFTGVESLTAIGGDLYIYNSFVLTSLVGLSNVTSIGENLFIGCESGYLSALTTLVGLYNLTTIGGNATLLSNSSLIDLEGLNNLTSIGETLTIDGNNILSSIEGISNIESIINNLNIRNNPLLSTCEVVSVCEYLANPTGNVSIFNNAPGCNSAEEVEEACLVSVESYDVESEFSIYPNPSKNKLFLSNKSGIAINEVNIYNQLGQKVLHESTVSGLIDISTLDNGIYVIELFTDRIVIRETLIVEK